MGKRREVLANFGSGYLSDMYLPVDTFKYSCNTWVIGHIEEGFDIIQECFNKNRDNIEISASVFKDPS